MENTEPNKNEPDLEQQKLNLQIHKMQTCQHLYVTSLTKCDPREACRTYGFYCIKCGLETKYADPDFWPHREFNPYAPLESEMRRLVKYEGHCYRGRHIDVECHAYLARAISKSIISEEPNISDEKLAERFIIILKSLREGTPENINERRKSLGLHPDFSHWHRAL